MSSNNSLNVLKYPELRRKLIFLQSKFWFFVSFVICKGLVFLTPLLFAEILTKNEFGILEYALSGLGFVLNTLLNLGVPGAYPYFILKQKKLNIKNGFTLHPLFLSTVFIINTFIYVTGFTGQQQYLAINIAYVIANQVFYSTQLKSHEKSVPAVFLDSGIYIILFVLFIASRLELVEVSIRFINYLILIYGTFYTLFGIQKYLSVSSKNSLFHYKYILRYSKNLLIATFLIFLITSSGRIVIEWLFGFEKVAIYGFYFRLAAVVVMIHQVINIIYFKRIYTIEPTILDRYFAMFFVFIYVLSLIFYFVSPLVMTSVSSFFNDTFLENKTIFFIISAQMTVWIASALNSSIIDRENLMKLNNLRFLVLVILLTCILFFFKDKISFEIATYLLYCAIFFATLIQYYSLYKKDILFIKSSIVLLTTFIISTMILYFG